MKTLYKALDELAVSDLYPLHMPGHKRNQKYMEWGLPFDRDITEIHGFDNLHHPEGILQSSMKELSRLYGSRYSFFSINGSTGAILAGIFAAIPKGSRVLIARNCHKSVYHALCLRELEPVFLWPRICMSTGGCGDLKPEQIEEALKEQPDIKALILTSPTYEGIVSDIRSISRICHSRGILVIVDEAHGAHFKFSDIFPDSAVDLGADLVIHSLHKTLPAMTQTAAIHLCSERIDPSDLQHELGVFQSSSPSYILMESLDRCVHYLSDPCSEADFALLKEQIRRIRHSFIDLSVITLAEPEDCFAYDPSRLLLRIRDQRISGQVLSQWLRQDFSLETEMETADGILALMSVGDTPEGFRRLEQAVKKIDHQLDYGIRSTEKAETDKQAESFYGVVPERVYMPARALEMKMKKVSFSESIGRISGEFIYLYPPGVPMIIPGERITGDLADIWESCRKTGRALHGLHDLSGEKVRVVKE